MSQYRIYHNPRCSKSRQTLQILQQAGIEPEIRLYMDQPVSTDELQQLLDLLQKKPSELVRSGEQVFKDLGLREPGTREEQIFQAMLDEPRLIERPIVVHHTRAVLGRPPEAVQDLID